MLTLSPPLENDLLLMITVHLGLCYSMKIESELSMLLPGVVKAQCTMLIMIAGGYCCHSTMLNLLCHYFVVSGNIGCNVNR